MAMIPRLLLLLALAGSLCTASCDKPAPVPDSSDPQGKDLVEGAVVAATETAGGIRLYKIIHVDDYPDPIGYEYHMIAYEPKAATFQEAADLWRKRELKVVLPWMTVSHVGFIKRDHRVLTVEKVTDAEIEPYIRARDSRK